MAYLGGVRAKRVQGNGGVNDLMQISVGEGLFAPFSGDDECLMAEGTWRSANMCLDEKTILV